MNIVFLALDVDLRVPRGEGVHVRELASNWVALGHRVRLVTANRGGAVPRTEHHGRAKSTLSQIVQNQRLARGWADVVYERRFSPKVSWAVSGVTGIPFVVEVNGVVQEERDTAGHYRPDGGWRRLTRRRMFRSAARVVTVSRAVRNDLVARYALAPDKVVIIPNGANTELFHPRDVGSCRRELGVPRDSSVVSFAGNLAAWQGVDVLVRACSILMPRVHGLQVLVVGGGREISRLRALAAQLGVAGVVRFEGPVPYERVPDYVNAADVCVAPFRRGRKASPIKVFEYLACGRPVVASDIDEIGDFLRDSSCGLVVDPEDEHALADAIERLIESPEIASAMGQRGREAVLRTATWQATAKRVAQVLEVARRETKR